MAAHSNHNRKFGRVCDVVFSKPVFVFAVLCLVFSPSISGFFQWAQPSSFVPPQEISQVKWDASAGGEVFQQEKEQEKQKTQEKQKAQKKEKPTAAQLEFFEKKIRPVLAEHCYSCHSSKAKSLQASLQCDSRAALLEGGDSGEAIVPGKADESLLIESLKYESYEMPPKGQLPDHVIADFEKWINMGAPWPEEADPGVSSAKKEFDVQSRKESHWAWKPITEPKVPVVSHKAWPKAPLDHFILKRLEGSELKPAVKNDRRSLARRLFFDITGLPPTPEQMNQFLSDDSPKAVENLVDRLLASSNYGERWGRHWLDLVRYAESRGHEFDNDSPNAFQYRDYVIRALNADVPYDQFVREHLAGDLLENPRLNPEKGFNESILGTGFWFLGEWVHSPVDILKDESDRFDNMIDVTSKTFLGMTVACARCHDHKFDAISIDDYYSLTGFLHSAEYRQVRFDSLEHNRAVSKELTEFDKKFQQELKHLVAKLLDRNREKAISVLVSDFQPSSVRKAGPVPAPKKGAKKGKKKPAIRIARPVAADTDRLKVLVDYSKGSPSFVQEGFSFRDRPVEAGSLLPLPVRTAGPLKPNAALQLKVQLRSAAVSDPAWNGLKNISEPVVTDRSLLRHLPRSGRTLHSPKFRVEKGHVSALVRGGGHFVVCVDSHRMIAGPLHTSTVKTIKDSNGGQLRWVTFNLSRYIDHSVQMEFTPLAGSQLEVYQIVEGHPKDLPVAKKVAALESLSKEKASAALDQFLQFLVMNKPLSVKLRQQLDRLVADPSRWANQEPVQTFLKSKFVERAAVAKKIMRESRVAMAMIDSTGEEARVMIRGNSSKLGNVVPRRFLSALDGLEKMPISGGSGRLELANRINADDNPLTSRVIANRVWHHMMGRGIVPTTDNFGVLGMKASHPELLDHLAVWFNRNGKSIKKLIKYIALSSTYQMGSHYDKVALKKDPANTLWHYNPPKRLQGESIRDSILAVAGRLDEKMYGKPVPIHLTDFMTGRGRPGKSGPLDGDGRRSIYVAVRRNFVSPFQLAFDMPVPFSSMGRRNVSNVPAQALILLNHPLVLQCANDFAARAIQKYPKDHAKRVHWLYEVAFGRPPSEREVQLALLYVGNEDGMDKTKKWAGLTHTLFNVKEFIFLK